MAASEHVAQLSETNNATGGNSIMDAMFRDYPNGLLYTQGDKLPSPFEDLLPEVATSAAGEHLSVQAITFFVNGHLAVPISKGKSEPFALICIYALRPDYHFQLPDATLSFLRSLGLVFCSVQQKQVLSLADKAKVDFIANISHELRTPLHGVIASCDLLSETSLDDAQESFLNTARQCASSLTETINHVLDFTKSTSQSTGHSREAVDLSQLIEETMTGCWLGRISSSENNPSAIGELYSPQNLEQTDSNSKINTKVEPLIEIEPLSNWTVMVDKAGLRRILINLIGNSMKFTQASILFIG
jgi:signal transduction histidine kinase